MTMKRDKRYEPVKISAFSWLSLSTQILFFYLELAGLQHYTHTIFGTGSLQSVALSCWQMNERKCCLLD
jgi:hypothetical protein